MSCPAAVEEGVALASLTTLEVGGPARYLARCRDTAELRELLQWGKAKGLPVFILGSGSNLLAADAGFDGLVIQFLDPTLELLPRGEHVLLRAGAGVEWDPLVERAVAEGLGGLECLSGIPGRVGAAPIQNVGAYGQEVSETIAGVEVVERATGTSRHFPGESCGFGYRSSHFKGRWRDLYVVTRVDFLLPRRQHGSVRYPQLAEVRAAVLALRRGKSMVLDPGDPNRRSAGSFFTNPVVAPRRAAAIRRRTDASMPAFPAPGDRVKLSAAWLIEAAGFRRGYGRGRVALSPRHVLALTNRGGATAAELIALASEVRRGVRAAFEVTLEPEPVLLGFSGSVDQILG